MRTTPLFFAQVRAAALLRVADMMMMMASARRREHGDRWRARMIHARHIGGDAAAIAVAEVM